MASDQSIAQVIFFVGAVLAASVIAGVFVMMASSAARTMVEEGNSLSDKMCTSIEIVNDPRVVPYENGTLSIYVMNTGTKILPSGNVTIFIDGIFVRPQSSTLVDGNTDAWYPSKIMRFDIGMTLSSGDHLVKVVLDNGTYDLAEFRI